jgi:hypothetical protein
MRHELVGYVLGALDENERRQVKETLDDPQLQHELSLLGRGIQPLSEDARHIDPPYGLAQRTCEFIEAYRTSNRASRSPKTNLAQDRITDDAGISRRRWSLIDLAVAAGILLALGMLILPAVNHSRFSAQVTACQHKLQQIGRALHDYGKNHDGRIPEIPREGRLSVAGVYAPKLLEAGLVSGPEVFICGDSRYCERRDSARIPKWGRLVELERSDSEELDETLAGIGGSYGYNLGYVQDGIYHTVSLSRSSRPNYALMADTPCAKRGFSRSSNHAGNGQNVLFEDLHVDYMTDCYVPGCSDELFRNEHGDIAAGTNDRDAVIGASLASPRGNVVPKSTGR